MYKRQTLNYDFFKERYLPIFNQIIVSTRVNEVNKAKGIDGYKILNGNNVIVKPIDSYSSVPDVFMKRKEIINQLRNVINKCDVVIIRMPSVLGIIASKICKQEKKKYLIEMVACAWDGYMNHTNPVGKIIAPFMYLKTKRCIKVSPNTLYVTNHFLQKRYPTKGNQCACSDVCIDNISNSILDDRITKIEKMNVRNLKICTVANVSAKYKGHIYVFKAIKRLLKNGYDIKYYLVGNGDTERLNKYSKKLGIENNIFFVGSLPHEKVFEKLKDMDIYIQPSLQEGLPRALIEAMSLGLPAIGSNAGGIPELLDDEMIFKKKKENQLFKIITRLNSELLQKHAKRNYNEAKKYTPEKLNNKRINFYKNI